MKNTLKIGLFGFGCVGTGLYEVLNQTKGIKAEIVKICVKNRDKKRSLPSELFTYNADELLDDPNIDVIVELIDNAEEAFAIVSKALKNKKAVVTANKKLVAEYFEELYNLQQEYNVPLLYEGACCASIPIIRNLEEYYDNDLLNAIEGIVNGTTNYILTKLSESNASYESALAGAQQKGFAESNPYLDVSGTDAKYKACILTAHAFGVFVNPEKVFNYGITNISAIDARYAKEKGYKIKLVAKSRKIGDEIGVWVIPQFVPVKNSLFQVDDEYNGVQVEAVFSDKQFFLGKGAGAYPTGSAVLSDISALTYNYRYEYKKYFQENKPQLNNNVSVELYVRFEDKSLIEDLRFENISEHFVSAEYGYVIGKISIQTLINADIQNRKGIFIAETAASVARIEAVRILENELAEV